jgi:hypothetical protein
MGPLGDSGTNFVNTYEERRGSVLAHQGPYVVVSGSSLTLHVPGKEIPPAQVLLDPYHALKDVAQPVPLNSRSH